MVISEALYLRLSVAKKLYIQKHHLLERFAIDSGVAVIKAALKMSTDVKAPKVLG